MRSGKECRSWAIKVAKPLRAKVFTFPAIAAKRMPFLLYWSPLKQTNIPWKFRVTLKAVFTRQSLASVL